MTGNFVAGAEGWTKAHLARYLETDGAEGHLVDFTAYGGAAATPCLILETIGRKSGLPQRLPLIYGIDGGRFVIVGSKGGGPNHPGWYFNIQADPKVRFQVGSKKYTGVAHLTEGAERLRLYRMMSEIYPPYIRYQEGTPREIPVVLLEPDEAA